MYTYAFFLFSAEWELFCDCELDNCRPSAQVIVSSRRMYVVVVATSCFDARSQSLQPGVAFCAVVI